MQKRKILTLLMDYKLQKYVLLSQYLSAAFLSLLLFVIITHGWHLSSLMPFYYSGDSLQFSSQIKSIIDTGWYIVNPYIGSPSGYELYDYPVSADNLHFLLFKILSYFTNNYVYIFNIYYILTFPVITLTSLYVFKRIGLKYSFALVGSLLYALLPYHFIRGQVGHFLLASYYIVPLATWICFLIANKQIHSSHLRSIFKIIKYLILCILIGSSGFYYAMFSIFFIAMTGLISTVSYKNSKYLFQGLALSGCIAFTVGINMSQTFHYRMQYGTNTAILNRVSAESELYGLKIVQMLLPVDNSRGQPLAHFKSKYTNSAPLVTHENGSAALGLIGGLGFLILIIVLIFGQFNHKFITLLSRLNISAILLATIGGFSSLVAYTVSPLLRCYSRISVFIAFFSLVAFFLILQKILTKYGILKNKLITSFILLFILGVGCFTQASHDFTNIQNAQTLATFKNDEDFVRKIELINPHGTIYQLPYVPFPENPPVNKMKDYEHLRPYMHSKTLHWSYGAIKGRPTAMWLESLNELPLSKVIKHLSYSGFTGIYINRNGYVDHGAAIEKELTKHLKIKPLISKNGELSFYSLDAYIFQFKRSHTQEWNQLVENENLRRMFNLSMGKGFYAEEKLNANTWYWSNKKSFFSLINYSKNPIKVLLHFKVSTLDKKYSDLIISGKLINEKLNVNSDGKVFKKVVIVPTGKNKIFFFTNTRQYIAPGDTRNLYFKLESIKAEPLH